MKIIDNINSLLDDDLKASIHPKAKLKIAASCFSIYAYEALKSELSKIDSLEFIFTAPTFVPNEVTDKIKKERREFFIPKANRERSLYGSEFEIQLRNKLTQRAIARECAEWMRRKAGFRSNKTNSPMQQFSCVQGPEQEVAYMPLHGFTAVALGYQQGDAVSNIVNRFDEMAFTSTYLRLFHQIWSDPTKLEDVTTALCDHIASVYQENSPERIYFLMLYNIFSDFLDDIDEDVLPNDRTGYQDTLVWNKLFNFQRDAAIGIINKLETYNGCILADSVGLGKTFTALAVVKYYELRNRSVLVLCPKKLADNWRNYNSNLTTNIFSRDRFNYEVLCHTDLSRTSGESLGIPLRRAGKKILEGECHDGWCKDIGFRVLKIDSSNMADVYYRPDAIDQPQVDAFVENIKPDRKPEELLFQVLLDWGVDLSLPIRKEIIQGRSVFFVDKNALVACFDTGVDEELVKDLAGFEPLRVVFRDNCFVSDAVNINVEQIFKQMSPGTEVKSL